MQPWLQPFQHPPCQPLPDAVAYGRATLARKLQFEFSSFDKRLEPAPVRNLQPQGSGEGDKLSSPLLRAAARNRAAQALPTSARFRGAWEA